MTRRDDLDGVLSAIDGALGDADLPDAMRWAPEPEAVEPDGAAIYAEDTAWLPRDPAGLPAFPLLPLSGLAVRHAAEHEANLARLREVLTLTPEQLARLGETAEQLGRAAQVAAEQIGRAFAALVEGLRPVREQLVDAGVLPDEGPADPRERALWLRQHRNTGPEVPRAQRARRPRRHA